MPEGSDLEARIAAADAICARPEDIQIIDKVPKYRPLEPAAQPKANEGKEG